MIEPEQSHAVSARFFFLLFGVILYEAARLFWPFIGAIGAAVVLAVIFRPWYDALTRKMPRLGPFARALLLDLCILCILIVPLGLLIWSAVSEAEAIYPILNLKAHSASEWLRHNPASSLPLLRHLPASVLRQIDSRSAQVKDDLAHLAERSLAPFANLSVYAAKHLMELILQAGILIFTLFFLLRDGESLYLECEALIPMARSAKRRLNKAVHDTIIGVVRGTLLISLTQTAIMTTGLLIVHAEAIVLLGLLTFVATFIPYVGTALISIPLALYFLAIGVHWKGFFLLIWGTLFIGVVDYMLRPIFLAGKGTLPFAWLFFAVLGGLEVFGLKGLLLGPLILALIPVLIDIYRDRYLDVPEDEPGDETRRAAHP